MNYLGTSMHDAMFTGESAAALKDKAFHAVKFDNDGNVALCDTEGEVVLGVLPAEEGNKAKGDTVTVQIKDIALMVAGGEIAAGAAVTTDANGKAKTATAGNFIIGYAMKAATGAGKVIPVQIAKGVMQGGSGGGRMEVTFSGVNWEDGTVSHADKTIEEIVAAIRAKKDVVGFLSEPDKIGDVWLQLVGLSEEEEEEGEVESETHFFLTFSGTAYNSTFTIIYANTHESGEPQIEVEMLELAAEDAIADKATMTVELRVIGSDIYGNKTFGEILNARMDGRNVLLNYDDTDTGNKTTSSVVDCAFKSNDDLVLVFFYASGQLVTASGRQNDSFNYKP